MDASRIVTRPEELLQHAGWVRKLVQELVRDPERRGIFGGFQGIRRDAATGTYFGASDPRKDGQAAGW